MIIDAPCGSIEGLVREGFLLFKGIPYAQPPVGALRFSPPQQMEPWNGVYKATEFGPICPQDSHEPGSFYHKEFYSGEAPRMDEDCLYLNIWTPKQWREPLPVAIWFHGGAYLNGHGAEMEFDGEAYAKRGVILVTVNYRLGFFGFFAHPKLKHSGNYGILDQIAAIDWVRENIGAFGGDTDNITVFGQSAGGGSVQTLVRSALTEGKVHKAIIQSAGGYKSPICAKTPLRRLEKACVAFMKAKKLTLSDMLTMSAERLLALQRPFMRYGVLGTGSLMPLSPCVDEKILSEDWDRMLRKNRVLQIPYLIGSTANDIMVSRSGSKHPSRNRMHISAMRMCQINNENSRPSYCYYFSRKMPGDDAGAFHSAELWYMFGTWKHCWRPLTKADEALSQEMLCAWVQFMKCGNPGWDKCTREDPYVKIFDISKE